MKPNLRKLREESRIVEIRHPRTRIRGVLRQSTRLPHLKYVAFLGIPYALPPVGKLRFQPPQRLPQLPPDQPTPLFLANNGSHPCTQRFADMKMGSEDCLYLNVYTPRKPKDIPELLPVLVHIHGGGFTVGENVDANPENLLREDLVVVTINYRLGIFGFLNFRTENCLGNAGMKDQVMALRWVRDNIEQFKGNPKNVTICGHGAGGSCVSFHMISPLSKGLFHKAIIMAAGVYSPWGHGGHAKHHIEQFIKSTTFHSKENRKGTYDLMEMGEDIMNAYMHPMKIGSLFNPSVECVKEGAFLPDTVEKLMEVAKPVPTLAGITKQEGYMVFSAHALNIIKLMEGKITFVELVKDYMKQNLGWSDPTAVDRHFEFFKNTYFPEDWMFEEEENVEEDDEKKPMTEEEKQRKDEEKKGKEEERKHRLATLFTDIFFRRFYDNFKIGDLLKEEGPPFYVYEFDYFAGEPLNDDNQNIIKHRAAQHADDHYYLFGPEYYVDIMLNRIAEKDKARVRTKIERVQSNMSSLWGSFCRTGYPISRGEGDANVEWKTHTEQDPHHLNIGEKLELKKGRLNEVRWSELNAICLLEPTIPSLPVSPQRSRKKCTESQPKLGSSSTQAPDTECEVSQLSRPKPDQSTTQTSTEDVQCESTPTKF